MFARRTSASRRQISGSATIAGTLLITARRRCLPGPATRAGGRFTIRRDWCRGALWARSLGWKSFTLVPPRLESLYDRLHDASQLAWWPPQRRQPWVLAGACHQADACRLPDTRLCGGAKVAERLARPWLSTVPTNTALPHRAADALPGGGSSGVRRCADRSGLFPGAAVRDQHRHAADPQHHAEHPADLRRDGHRHRSPRWRSPWRSSAAWA